MIVMLWGLGLRTLLAAALASLTTAAGCAMPGITTPFEGVRRSAVGTHSVGGALVYTGDSTPPSSNGATGVATPGVGADLRYSAQVSAPVAIVVDALQGVIVAPSSRPAGSGGPDREGYWFGAARLGTRIHPIADYVAITAGFGGGYARESGHLVGDVGVRVGGRVAGDRVEPLVAQSFSLTGLYHASLGWRGVGYSTTEVGLNVYATPAFSVGAFLTMIFGFTEQATSTRPAFFPIIAVNYRFGR